MSIARFMDVDEYWVATERVWQGTREEGER